MTVVSNPVTIVQNARNLQSIANNQCRLTCSLLQTVPIHLQSHCIRIIFEAAHQVWMTNCQPSAPTGPAVAPHETDLPTAAPTRTMWRAARLALIPRQSASPRNRRPIQGRPPADRDAPCTRPSSRRRGPPVGAAVRLGRALRHAPAEDRGARYPYHQRLVHRVRRQDIPCLVELLDAHADRARPHPCHRIRPDLERCTRRHRRPTSLRARRRGRGGGVIPTRIETHFVEPHHHDPAALAVVRCGPWPTVGTLDEYAAAAERAWRARSLGSASSKIAIGAGFAAPMTTTSPPWRACSRAARSRCHSPSSAVRSCAS